MASIHARGDSSNDRVTPAEDIKAEFEFESLAKLRQTVIAQLAAENKMQNTDFQKVYERAEETGWEVVREAIKQSDIDPSRPTIRDQLRLRRRQLTLHHSGTIRDEKIMWGLGKNLEQGEEYSTGH